MKTAIKNTIKETHDLLGAMVDLKCKGIETNSVLIGTSGVSISLESGIEKAAGAMGAELSKSPSGTHLWFDSDGVHFGQKIKEK